MGINIFPIFFTPDSTLDIGVFHLQWQKGVEGPFIISGVPKGMKRRNLIPVRARGRVVLSGFGSLTVSPFLPSLVALTVPEW